MPNTDKGTVIVQKAIDLIAAQGAALGLATKPNGTYAVYYGDEDWLPKFPSITVESGEKIRSLTEGAVGKRFAIAHRVLITIFHGKVQEEAVNKKAAETLAEAVEDVLMANKTFDGLVVFGFVTSIDPGIAVPARTDSMVAATRLTWEGVGRKTG